MAFIPLKTWPDKSELATITLSVDQQPFIFLIDTGSNISHIDEKVATKLNTINRILQDDAPITGISGELTSKGKIKLLLHAKMFVFEQEFIISNLSSIVQAIQESGGPEIHGLLGMNFLTKYRCHIDFKKNKLHFN